MLKSDLLEKMELKTSYMRPVPIVELNAAESVLTFRTHLFPVIVDVPGLCTVTETAVEKLQKSKETKCSPRQCFSVLHSPHVLDL